MMSNRNCSWISYLAIRDSLLSCYIEALITGGSMMTSTLDVITRDPPSVSSRSKTETASVATPLLSGLILLLLRVIILATLMQCCSTCLAPVNSLPNDQPKIFGTVMKLVLVSVEIVTVTYQHLVNHLMVMKSAAHMQIVLVMVSLMKVVWTCSLTRRMEASQ